ncbi:hypothetical protein QC761_501520 [Podospora bellae-mahoneyi]|uniref:Uncharacterized protein n=1 Tax=Podospora bellae-mahoneyi TaxID=2093777 RepID=A0ABR0FBW9_9PEZI|nr:hypothetical protein QC761_501520 [Podospora bellae-mahoneyi]
MPLQFTSIPGQGKNPGHPSSTPPIPTTGSPPFQVDSPTPAARYPVTMGTPAGTDLLALAPTSPSLPLPPPTTPLGSFPATIAAPLAGSPAGPPGGHPDDILGMLQREQTALEKRFVEGKNAWGYASVPHTDIVRYGEVLANLATATAANAPVAPAVPVVSPALSSVSAASLNREMARLADLEKILRQREKQLLQAEVEAKASLDSLARAIEEKKHQLAGLEPREAELLQREAVAVERETALNEREDALTAGEDALDKEKEDLEAREKAAAAILEQQKIVETQKVTLRLWREDLDDENKALEARKRELEEEEKNLEEKKRALEEKERRPPEETELGKKEEGLRMREEALKEKEKALKEKEEELKKKNRNFVAVNTSLVKKDMENAAREKEIERRLAEMAEREAEMAKRQAALDPRSAYHSLPSGGQTTPQFVADMDQRVVIGYDLGWQAALPIGVEQGRRAAAAQTTTMHIQHQETVLARIRNMLACFGAERMDLDVRKEFKTLQLVIKSNIDVERIHADSIEMTADERLDASIPKPGNKVWEFIRVMKIECGCPVYYYFPAHPKPGPQPTAGIVRPAPQGETPQSLGVAPVTIVGNTYNLPPDARVVFTAPAGPDPALLAGPIPSLELTAPGGVSRTITGTPGPNARRRVRSVTPSPGALQPPPRADTKRARSESPTPAPAPAPKRTRCRLPKNKNVIAVTTVTDPPPAARPGRPIPGGLRPLAVAPAPAVTTATTVVGTTTAQEGFTSSAFAPAPAAAAPAPPTVGVEHDADDVESDEEQDQVVVQKNEEKKAEQAPGNVDDENKNEGEDGMDMHLAAPVGWMERKN